jgi:hypothetical protein
VAAYRFYLLQLLNTIATLSSVSLESVRLNETEVHIATNDLSAQLKKSVEVCDNCFRFSVFGD